MTAVSSTTPPPRRGERYPLRNASEVEDRRLARLEALSDPITVAAFEALGVGPGWHCAELGAGRGSMVRWLAERVGGRGSVTAIDRDTTRLVDLAHKDNVELLEGDLCTMALPADAFDLVHSRSVLMHLECPNRVVEAAVAALRPGGRVFFEESDGGPAAAARHAPEPFTRVMLPMARRWTWARTLAGLLESLGLVDVGDDRREMRLMGDTPNARFWQLTLESVSRLAEEVGARGDQAGAGFERADLEAMSKLLDDPSFSVPFVARHRVTGRRPG
jgi:SAM-dependent methyltransferase